MATLTYSFPAVGGSNPCWTYDANDTNNNHFNNYKNNETMFKTIYTITVGEFAEMLATNDYKLAVTVKWLPKFISRIAYYRLVAEFNKNFDPASYDNKLLKDIRGVELVNKVNVILPALVNLYTIAKLTNDDKLLNKVNNIINDTFHVEVKDDVDYKQLFKTLYDKMNVALTRHNSDFKVVSDASFEDTIILMESVIKPITLRDKKLYTLSYYYNNLIKNTVNHE